MKDKVEYEEKDLRTHVFESPDTYAGSDEQSPDRLPIMKEDGMIEFSDIELKSLSCRFNRSCSGYIYFLYRIAVS